MELIFEILLELILEGSIETSQNKKVSKWIRYPLIFIICLFFLGVFCLLMFIGIISLKQNLYLGIFLILVSPLLVVASILKFKKVYLSKQKLIRSLS